MKSFAKTAAVIAAGALAAIALAGCGPSEELPTIIYRSWDLGTEAANNEERQLVKAFEDSRHVRVQIVENPGDGAAYWLGIKASVTTKIDLADVMMLPNLDWPLSYGFLANVKDLSDADEEFQHVPASVREACAFKNGVYALPARMNLQGYFLNTTLIDHLGLDAAGITVDSPATVIDDIIGAAASDPNAVGLDTAAHFIDVEASVTDATHKQGYFTWDGAQYHLNEDPFISGVQKGSALFQSGKTLDSYTDEQKEALGLDPDIDPKVDAWNKGKLALRYGFTFEMGDMLKSNDTGATYRFIGNPGGKITIVGDYYGIYKDSPNRELAYDFAKYMSFGKEGFAKRMEIYKRNNKMINTLPLTDDQGLIHTYFADLGSDQTIEGLDDAFDYIKEHSMVEGVKVVPGFGKARWDAATGVNLGEQSNLNMFALLDACYKGELNIVDYVSGETNIDTIADKTYADWMANYGAGYP